MPTVRFTENIQRHVDVVGAARQWHLPIHRSRRVVERDRERSPFACGFAVAVPRDPETAWFVPAVKDEKRYPADGRLVVNRTHDGGKTFETQTKGLPQEH